MTVPHTHSCITGASIPIGQWHEAEPLLESWKSLLQSLPGHIHTEVLLRELENRDVRCLIRVTWEYAEQLEEFMQSRWAPESLLGSMSPGPYDLHTERMEQYM